MLDLLITNATVPDGSTNMSIAAQAGKTAETRGPSPLACVTRKRQKLNHAD